MSLKRDISGEGTTAVVPEVLLNTMQRRCGAILRALLRDSGGSQIAEAAMVMPLMFTILLGIFWFGRAYNVYATIARAAQEGAAVAATSTCGSCGNAPATPASIASAVTAAMQVSRLDPRQIASNPISPATACPNSTVTHDTPNNIDIYRNVQLNPGSTGPVQCGVIVTFKYPYQFYLPFTSLNMQRINMTAAAERQMEN